VCVALVF